MVKVTATNRREGEGAGTAELRAGNAVVTIDVDRGGRLAQIEVGGQPLLWNAPGPAIGWGSYPMAPWVGRVRNGRFTFDGVDHELAINHTDDDGTSHAIHGTVFDTTWTVDQTDTTTATLHADLGRHGWPFGGVARQTIALDASGVRCQLSVESSRQPFPAAIGWHPWFLKPGRLDFRPAAMFRRDGIGLPTADLVEPVTGPWDDTFLNTEPVSLHYPDRVAASTVTVTSDCDHWVVYDQPTYATCVEPQSGPPDALTMQPRLVTTSTPLRRWMRITWT
jgi:aldose 1-epimerase